MGFGKYAVLKSSYWIFHDLSRFLCMPPNMSTECWATSIRIAQCLGVAKGTVYRWRERTDLPAHRMGIFWKPRLSAVGARARVGGGGKVQAENEKEEKR